jgi:predicted transposase YbfD/YdcC
VAVGEKTNEIPCIKPLLADLNIEGAVITADALHTQKESARFIVEDKKADYVFTVKEYQRTLLQDIQDLGLEALPPLSTLM